MKEILQKVQAAESQADRLELEANIEAQEMIVTAKNEVATLLEDSLQRAYKEANELLLDKRNSVAMQIQEMNKGNEATKREIIEQAENRLPQAIRFVIDKVVISFGNS